jgi:hypothetical protein
VWKGDGSRRVAPSPEIAPIEVGAHASDLLFAEGTEGVAAIVADPARDRVAVFGIAGGKLGAARDTPLAPGPRALATFRDRRGAWVAAALSGPAEPRGVVLLALAKGSSLAPAQERLNMTLHPASIAAADFDGDGETDLAVLATQSGGDSQGFVATASRPAISTATGARRSSSARRTRTT